MIKMKNKKSTLENIVPCAVIQVLGNRDPDNHTRIFGDAGYLGLPNLMQYAEKTNNHSMVDEEFDQLISKTAKANEEFGICNECIYRASFESGEHTYVPCPRQVAPELFIKSDD